MLRLKALVWAMRSCSRSHSRARPANSTRRRRHRRARFLCQRRSRADQAILDEIQQSIGHEGHSDQSLSELRDKLAPNSRRVACKVRRARSEACRGRQPPVPAWRQRRLRARRRRPPAIAEERAKLAQTRAEVDAALKETRLLSVRADDIAARINETRRDVVQPRLVSAHARHARPGFWTETVRALRTEGRVSPSCCSRGARYARRHGGISRRRRQRRDDSLIIGLSFFAVAYAMAAAAGARCGSRSHASAGLHVRWPVSVVLIRHAVLTPLCVFVVVKVSGRQWLLLPIIADLGNGLAVAVAVASFGYGIAQAVLAPAASYRRLVNADELQARRLASYLTWSARILGAAIFLNIMHKAVGAPLSSTVATSALLSGLIGLLTLYLLIAAAARRDQRRPALGALPGLGAGGGHLVPRW